MQQITEQWLGRYQKISGRYRHWRDKILLTVL